MSPYLSIDAVARTFADELLRVCTGRFGAETTSAPTDAPTTAGFTITVPVTGAVTGRVVLWFDRESAAACARLVGGSTELTEEQSVTAVLIELGRDTTTAVAARSDAGGLEFGEPVVSTGLVSPSAQAYYVAVPNTLSCLLAIDTERVAPPQGAGERLDAVLDVELPVVVRFGRTVMPLHAVAELGPGSVIDMGRSPDEPVDVLVGDRVIGRGEVVVVSGNYGVCITSLSSGREAVVNKEARAL